MHRTNPFRAIWYPVLLGTVQSVLWAAPPAACSVSGGSKVTVTDVQLEIDQALGSAQAANDFSQNGVVNVVDVQIVIGVVLGYPCPYSPGAPAISSFTPTSGPVGTLVTVTGSNFGTPQVTMAAQGGGSIAVPVSAMNATSLQVVVPSGAATGGLAISNGIGTAFPGSFTVTPPSTFSITVSPSSATLIQGQSVAYAIQPASANGFDQLAQLSVTGVPAGVTAAFSPAGVQAGQFSVLTLTAPGNQAIASMNLSITAAASVQGLPVSQSATVSLAVVAPTTSLIGRTVVSDPSQTPLAGVTVSSLGQDGNGNSTGCMGFSTISDAAGNFAISNLPQACTGPQLFNFNGGTATSPAGQYAGVNLMFTLVLGQVTPSPVLVHLPRIDNVETFNVTQNSTSDQTYSYQTIPGLSVTVYAGTTLTLPDGTKPNPFPLAAVQVPVDRLPDLKPNVPTMIRVFIVAFQPAESTASQPVAITFPNVSNTPPGTDMPLMTLNPIYGQMVPYGTGAVSADGTVVVPDMDPAHSGHRYGLVHFDWHGQMPPGANQSNPGCGCSLGGSSAQPGGPPSSGDPVDLASGLQLLSATDLAIHGSRGTLQIARNYRTLTTNDLGFGIGWQISYGWELNTGTPNSAAAIELIAPDGNQYLFSRQTNGTLTNSSAPFLQGAVMTTNASNVTTLRYPNGTVYQFQGFAGISPLYSITDRNSNTTTFTETPLNATAIRITKITDPVGRSLTLAYDGNSHCTSVTDPIGRKVSYTYNSSGTLATETDPNGGVTTYSYDSQNRMVSMTDARGVVMFQNVYDANGHVIQQTEADGGVYQYAYTMANPMIVTSPIISTTVTDPLGNQTTYRFNIQSYLTDVTDAMGQTKSFIRAPGTNLILEVTGSAQCAVCGPAGQGPMTYTYDSLGNVLTSTDALGNTVTYTYNANFSEITSATDPLNHTRSYAYDANGNLTGFTDENGHTVTLTYDTYGQPLTVTDPLGNKATFTYDSSENPATATDAAGSVTSYTYDAVSRITGSADALNRKTALTYDPLDRILSMVNGRNNTTAFSYDAVGNVLSFTDPKNNSTTFTYDAMDRVKKRTDPLGRSESNQYDMAGNLTGYTDRRGQVAQFQYDALNRMVEATYGDGSTAANTYDPYSRLLTTTDSAGGAFTWEYDAAGRLITQSEPTGTVNYTRDALGRVATRQVAGQTAVTYAYDAAGNLLSAATPAAGMTWSYDARNLPARETRTNGITSAYSFDAVANLLSLVHSKGATALETQTYTYDAVGNRIAASNNISQALTTPAAAASVDAANELLANAQTTYTYDANGNRLSESGPGGSYTYTWDGRNRLASVTDGSGNTTSFRYDAGRNLTRITRSNGLSQSFVFDTLSNVVSLTDASGLPAAVLTGRTIDSHAASVSSSGAVTFGIGDPLGSIAATTDANGNVVTSFDYEPYGQTTGSEGAAYPFSFTGRVPIAGNIVYYRNRFYDSGTGRFISEDPIPLSSTSGNLYAYVEGNPLNLIDPLGLVSGGPVEPEPQPTWIDEAASAAKSAYTFGKEAYSTYSTFMNNLTGEGQLAKGEWELVGGVKDLGVGIAAFGAGTAEDATVVGAPLGIPTEIYGIYKAGNGVKGIATGVKDIYRAFFPKKPPAAPQCVPATPAKTGPVISGWGS
ncbi:MAG TPA: RHS repeat-associated core domain-containing protein [Bryobacteraceae bacterium]|nr:RHS repeat-associated core domain-containing protein [Bryobacteraceae bacterium]